MVITAKVVFFMERAQDWFKVSCNSSQSFYVRLVADYRVLENLYRYHLALYEQSIQAGGSLVDLSRDVDKAGGAMLAPDKSLIDRLDRYKDFEVQLTENISEIFNYVHAEVNRWLSAEYSRYHMWRTRNCMIFYHNLPCAARLKKILCVLLHIFYRRR